MKRGLSPGLIVLLLSAPFIALVMTGQVKFQGAFFLSQAVNFNPAGSVTATQLSICGSGTPFGCTPWASAAGTQGVPGSISFTGTAYYAGSGSIYSNYLSTGTAYPGSSPLTVASGQVCYGTLLGICQKPYSYAITSISPALTGQILPTKLVGGDATFCQISGESCNPTPPPGTTCTITPGLCNPFTVKNYYLANGQNFTQTYNLYRFGFILQLGITGDKVTAQTQCSPAILYDGCAAVDVNALNQALNGGVNQHSYASGTVKLDISIPIAQGFVATPADKYGIIGTWIGENGQVTGAVSGCLTGLPQGGYASINPCQGHAPISNTLPLGQWQDYSQYSLSQLVGITTSALTPSTTLTFQIVKLGPQYTALCGNTGSCGTGYVWPGTSSSLDCLTAGIGSNTPLPRDTGGTACFIDGDYGIIVQIPVVMDVLATTTTSLPVSTGGICNYGGTYPNCVQPTQCQLNPQACNVQSGSNAQPNVTVATGSINVHLQDALLPLPIAGINVNVINTLAGGCSATIGGKISDGGGNALFNGLTPGSYNVCASGGSGTLTLIFFTVGIVYTQNSGVYQVSAGQVTSVTIPLQGNLMGVLTTTSLILFAMGLVALIAVIVIAPSSLGLAAGGFARSVRSRRGRRR